MGNFYEHQKMNLEEELNFNKKMVEALTANSSVAFIVCDVNNRVMHVNEMFEQTFGWQREEVIGEFLPIFPNTDDNQTPCYNTHLDKPKSYEATRKRKVDVKGQGKNNFQFFITNEGN